MIKIFLALGTIASLGTPLLPQRGLESANSTQTFNAGDKVSLTFDTEPQAYYEFTFDINKAIQFDTYTTNCTFDIYSINMPLNYKITFTSLTVLVSCEFEANTSYDFVYIPLDYDDFYFRFYVPDDFVVGTDYRGFNTTLYFTILEDGTELPVNFVKVQPSYTPPQKSNLYRYIYDFYYSLFNEGDLSAITISGLNNMPFDSWLCHTLTIITLITGIFILFLLLRWLFKVISGFILLK